MLQFYNLQAWHHTGTELCVFTYFWCISIVKPTRCTSVSNYFILEWHSTCFRWSFRPSSRVQDCTYGNRHTSDRYFRLLASGCEMEPQFHLVPASKQKAVSVW